MFFPHCRWAIGTGPSSVTAMPVRHAQMLLPIGQAVRHRAISVQHKRTAVEHQFILSADPVQEHQRQTRFPHTRREYFLKPAVILVYFIRAAIGRNEQLRPAFFQVQADRRKPAIFAYWHPHTHTAKLNWLGEGASGKNPFFIESAIIRQLMLVAHRRNPSAVEKRNAVV